MPDFDPFGGGPSGNDFQESYTPKPSIEKKKVKQLITMFIILAVIVIGVYFVFFYNATISFNIKDTEGKTITDARIILAKDSSLSDKTTTLTSGESKKVRKGTYYYSVQKLGYKKEGPNKIIIKEDVPSETITLEKNMKFTIDNIIFPSQLYAGQEVNMKLDVENKSPAEIYTFEDIIFDDDIKDWNSFKVKDSYGNIKNPQEVLFQPQTKQNITIIFRVPYDIEINKSNNATLRIKGTKKSETAKFEVIKEPEIETTLNIEEEMKSGDSKSFKLTINNRKNDFIISDITIHIDVNSDINPDVLEWFDYSKGDIDVDKKEKKDQLITVNVPINARNDNIKGTITLNSTAFKEPHIHYINLNIKEPEINFNTSISKSNIYLDYDVNTNSTSEEYITLELENKNDIDLKINTIYYEPITLRQDCNNFIYISPNSIPDKILKNNTSSVLINIRAINPDLVGELENNSRGCAIKVNYMHPYRDGEYLEQKENITIFVNEK